MPSVPARYMYPFIILGGRGGSGDEETYPDFHADSRI
jgi:hypothetical protein